MELPEETTCTGVGFLSRMGLNDNKAGMEGLDRDKINKIILEVSKGSRFYENELKKDRQVNQRIERMLQQKAQITEQQLGKAQVQVEKMAADLERGRELGRVIVHVDMDAFYAAVEMRDCPELKDKPMAVGSNSMLSTSNYHARKFGVRAAMPGFIAKKLCPGLVIVPPNFDKYRAVSAEVREIFADYDPNFLAVSLDEAYLDISEHVAQRRGWPESVRTHPVRAAEEGDGKGPPGEGDADSLSPVLFEDSPSSSPAGRGAGRAVVFGTCAEEAVREMRFRIEQRTTLTASAGIAPNSMLAKVCSDKNKPNGQYRIPAERQTVLDFIQDLPIRKVPGIGKVTEKMLGALGITSCSQLRQKVALLSLLFSETSWHHFLQISLGLGSTHIERDGERKSMSTERTFGEMSSAEEQYELCRELCRDLAQDLQKEGLKGKTVTVKLKNVNFEVKTRASTVSAVVSSEEEIFAVAKDLLKTEIENASPQPLRLRLMGVRVSGFVSSEDRKPLQKSIIGFLQSGRSETCGATQPAGQVPRAAPANQEEPSRPLDVEIMKQGDASASVVQETRPDPVKPEGVATILSRPKAESFFQMMHAQRLQMQEDAQGRGDGPVPPRDEQPTTSRSPEGAFTCPVCFREQASTDLGSFNRHVDECLSGVSAGQGDLDTDPETGVGTGDEDSCSLDAWVRIQPAAALNEAGAKAGSGTIKTFFEKRTHSPVKINKETSVNGACTLNRPGLKSVDNSKAGSHTFFPLDSINENSSAVDRPSNETVDGQGGRSTESRSPGRTLGSPGPALTCPVCNQQQDTSDLALFNSHVDLCLNQSVLLELRGAAVSHNSNIAPGAKVKGQCLYSYSKMS
ncbi:DNA polymerase kappa [Megalops cyprinoides]|uniref:DNA polymerase kappa n=1 Tax=Megalops cyprinoides TaxID=118141 RepID=UPI001864F670|nr:DNA polymerase kappa [Megalops cyprinoides]